MGGEERRAPRTLLEALGALDETLQRSTRHVDRLATELETERIWRRWAVRVALPFGVGIAVAIALAVYVLLGLFGLTDRVNKVVTATTSTCKAARTLACENHEALLATQTVSQQNHQLLVGLTGIINGVDCRVRADLVDALAAAYARSSVRVTITLPATAHCPAYTVTP